MEVETFFSSETHVVHAFMYIFLHQLKVGSLQNSADGQVNCLSLPFHVWSLMAGLTYLSLSGSKAVPSFCKHGANEEKYSSWSFKYRNPQLGKINNGTCCIEAPPHPAAPRQSSVRKKFVCFYPLIVMLIKRNWRCGVLCHMDFFITYPLQGMY